MRLAARVHLYPPGHCAGAEMMLHELLKALVLRGHEVEVHLSRPGTRVAPYVLDGVAIYPRQTRDWQACAAKADALITHLDNTTTMVSAAIAFDKPLIQVLHNTHAPTKMWATCKPDLLVYNSEWMRAEMGDHPHGIVVRPPVRVADYAVPDHEGYAVTLINTSARKGGVLFAQLAAVMPDVEFLGVKGAYSTQLDPRLSNAEMRPHGGDMLGVYADTRILIMPSAYESWGRTGVEAMCSGIPVIANSTPGLHESLGDAGIFLDPEAELDQWQWVIGRLLDDPDAYDDFSARARARAGELDPTHELAAFCDRVEAL